MTKQPKKPEPHQAYEDQVLSRMLAMPPDPHKPLKKKPPNKPKKK